jgi:hypothetical protein
MLNILLNVQRFLLSQRLLTYFNIRDAVGELRNGFSSNISMNFECHVMFLKEKNCVNFMKGTFC